MNIANIHILMGEFATVAKSIWIKLFFSISEKNCTIDCWSIYLCSKQKIKRSNIFCLHFFALTLCVRFSLFILCFSFNSSSLLPRYLIVWWFHNFGVATCVLEFEIWWISACSLLNSGIFRTCAYRTIPTHTHTFF